MTRHYLIVFLVLLLCISGVTYWFLENFELREEEFPTGYEGEARNNPYYAARLFLREMGIDAVTIDMPELNRELPDQSSTLIITTLRGSLDEQKSLRLLEWVTGGGHLVVRSAEPEYFDPEDEEFPLPPKDPLLDQLKITPLYNHNSELKEDSSDIDFESADGGTISLDVEFNSDYILLGEKRTDSVALSFNGTHAIHRRLERGAVTVVSDMNFMKNYSLGDNDHARVFWEIANWKDHRSSKVFILHNDNMPPLTELLWKYLRPLIITLGLILFFWLAKGLFRFGPLLPLPQKGRRSLMEHIEASGHFFWQDKQQHRLIEQTRKALQKKLISVHPGWSDLDNKAREQHLAELIQMPVATVRQLLHGDETYQTQDFSRIIQQLETIRKQL